MFAYWIFAVLHSFYLTNRVAFSRFFETFRPAMAPDSFAWAVVGERLVRVAGGHGGVALWVMALLGVGVIVGRFIWNRARSEAIAPGASCARDDADAGAEWLVLSFGLGMAASILLMLGLGLVGLWFPIVAWVLVFVFIGTLLGAVRLWGRVKISVVSSGWLLAGLSSEIVLSVFLAVAFAMPVVLGVFGLRGGGGEFEGLVWAWGAVALGGWVLWVGRRAARAGELSAANTVTRGLVILLAVEAAVALMLLVAASSVPERFYDAQVYHLGVPSLFAMHHKVIGLPNLLHASFPLGMQVLYGWQWLLGGEPVVRAWRPWLFCLVTWLVWRMLAREGRPQAGVVAACIFATCPILLLNSMQTCVDVEVCFLVLLASLAARGVEADPSPTVPGSMHWSTRNTVAGAGAWSGISMLWMTLCAIFTGAAFAMKYTVVFWLPVLAWLAVRPTLGLASGHAGDGVRGLWRGLKDRSKITRAGGRRLIVFGCVVACCLAPWFIRNAVVVGNPVYPYATSIFSSGRQWDPLRHEKFLEQSSTYMIKSASDFVLLPWVLSRGNNSETFIGPVFLLFLPLLLLRLPVATPVRRYGMIAALSLALWLPVTHIHRFLMATWGLLSMLVAWVVWDLGELDDGGSPATGNPRLGRPVQRAAALIVLVAVGAGSVVFQSELWRSTFDPVEFLAGRESGQKYLERKMINSYSAMIPLVAGSLDSGSRILMVGETRGLYWPVPFLNHSVYDLQVFEEIISFSSTPAEAAKRMRQRGVTHIFVNDAETSRMKFRFGYPMLSFSEREGEVIAGLWRRWMRSEGAVRGRMALYGLRREPGEDPVPPPLSFNPVELQRTFEGYTEITWEGGAVLQATKRVDQ